MRHTWAITLLALVWWGCQVRTTDDHLRIASALEAAGQSDSALVHLNEAVRKDGKHLWARIERGVLRSHLGDHAGARADDDTVLALDPENQTALFNRALAKGRLGDHAGAVNDLETLMRLKSPGWDENAPGNAHVFMEMTGNAGMGIEPPEFDVPYKHVGYAFALSYLELDSTVKAYDWLSVCIEQGFEVGNCLYERGILLLRHGRNAEGCSDLEQAAIQRHEEARNAWTRHCAGSTP
ncbi:MAG: tetratricopeptide repeat protein [Flavobacteriales bacterium]